MDWKKKMEELKSQADGVMKKAEAEYGEMKAKLDKDGDGTPDALEKLSEQTRHAIEQARAKAAEIAKTAQEKLGKKPPTEPAGDKPAGNA